MKQALNGDFRKLWAGQTISVFGSMIGRTALPFTAILVLGASPLQMGWLAAADLAPRLLIGLAAGAWIDRLRRRPVMIAADLGRALLLASIPVAAVLSRLSLAQLYLVQALAGALTMLFDAAYPAYLPSVVGRERLLDGNAKLSASAAAAEVGGFGIAGWLVKWFTGPVAIGIDAASFVVSAFFLGAIRSPETAPHAASTSETASEAPAPEHNLGREIREGLRCVFAVPVLRTLAAATIFQDLAFGLIGSVILYYTTRVLGFGTGAQGLIFAVGGMSSFLAAAGAAHLTRRVGMGPAMVAGLLLSAVGTLFIPLARGASVASAAMLVANQLITDPSYTLYEINAVTLRQSVTPPRLLGRVNATLRFLGLAAMLLGAQAGGLLGQQVGPRAALLAGSAAGLLGALWLLASPIRTLRGGKALTANTGESTIP